MKPSGYAHALMAVLLALASAWAAHAQSVPSGRLLASNCFQCHGTNGRGPGFERLNGESAAEIYNELKELQSGKEGNGLMAKHALGYTDAQLRALSDWLSRQR
jgi:cytochrome subunit of sulfide dehydrogenase